MSNYDDIKAECYEANLLLPEYKLIDLTFGNVCVADLERRVFAIKPNGVEYSAMKVDDMVVVAFAQAGRGIPCLGTTHADYFYGEVPVTRPTTRLCSQSATT